MRRPVIERSVAAMFRSTPKAEVTFLIRPGAPLPQAQLQPGALDRWRDAELLVRLRWYTFLEAGRASRPGAFAAYVAALDAEAEAAGEIAEAA
jgi:hypothetical protein